MHIYNVEKAVTARKERRANIYIWRRQLPLDVCVDALEDGVDDDALVGRLIEEHVGICARAPGVRPVKKLNEAVEGQARRLLQPRRQDTAGVESAWQYSGIGRGEEQQRPSIAEAATAASSGNKQPVEAAAASIRGSTA